MEKKCMPFGGMLVLIGVLLLLMGCDAAPAQGSGGAQIYAECAGEVMYIRALKEDGGLKTFGSAFLIGEDGRALTAAHVIADAAAVEAEFDSGLTLTGVKVLYQDSETDIAVIKLPERVGSEDEGYDALAQWYEGEERPGGVTLSGEIFQISYRALPLAQAAPAYGAQVFALGYPLRDGKIIAEGIVSTPEITVNGNKRMLVSNLLTSGMSGGPIIDENGCVVGLVSGTIVTMNSIGFSPTTEQIIAVLSGLQ